MPLPTTGGSGSGTTLTSSTITQTAHGFAVGDIIYQTTTLSTYALASAAAPDTSEWIGIVQSVPTANTFTYSTAGLVTIPTTSAANIGSVAFLSTVGTTGNTTTFTEPTAVSSVSKPVYIVLSTTTALLENYRAVPAAGNTAVVQTGSVTSAITSSQSTTSTSFTDVTGSAFTLPIAGTYKITYSASAANTTAGQAVNFVLTDSANAIIPGGAVGSTNLTAGGFTTGSISVQVTVAGTTSYKLRWAVSAGTGTILNTGTIGNSGNTTITWEQIGASPVPMDLVGEYGEVAVAGQGFSINAAYVDFATPVNFTLPTAGTWDVTYILSAQTNTAGTYFQPVITDSLNNVVANSSTQLQNGGSSILSPVTMTVRITTTSSTAYKLRYSANTAGTIYANNAPSNGGVSKVVFRKISGFTPSSGQTVDYVIVKNKVTTANVANQAFFKPDTIVAGNIPYNATTGLFTLTAGKTYELVADLAIGGGQSGVEYAWKDTVSGLQFGSQGVSISDNGVAGVYSVLARAIYTPSTNTTVGVVNIFTTAFPLLGAADTTSTGSAGLSQPSMTIKQLGTSAVITQSTTPLVLAQNSTSQSITNSGANVVVTNWTTVTDVTGSFNATTGVFTCPRAGNYAVSANLIYTSSLYAVQNVAKLAFLKNGTSFATPANNAQNAGTFFMTLSGSSMVSCAAGDTLSLATSNGRTAGATTLDGAALDNTFSITFIPPTY